MFSNPKRDNQVIIILLLLVLLLIGVLVYMYTTKGFGLQESDTQKTKEIVNLENLEKPNSPFLEAEEVVVVAAHQVEKEETEGKNTEISDPVLESVVLPVQKVLFEYVEVIDGCGVHFEGECLRVRSGPGTDYPVVSRLRNGMVLKVDGKVEREGVGWYKIVFDEWLRYPERVTTDWYVAAEYVKVLLDEGNRTVAEHGYSTTSKKVITVSRSEQKLYAFEGNELFMEASVSTGLELTPTPRGTFMIYKKTPSRYMQGPLPYLADRSYYDLPGVPWNMYFTEYGAVIHGAYWHKSFGSPYSHGCVNLSPEQARELYSWAELGTTVIVKN